MINFGKYKGKHFTEILDDHDYIKYLSNYHYGCCCTSLEPNHDECDDDCQYKVLVSDKHLYELDSIMTQKDFWIRYWNHINEDGKYSEEEIINPKNNIWNELEQISNDMEKIRIIYNNRDYFEIECIKWQLNQNGTFATFYLILHHPEIIQDTRQYLIQNKICLYCGITMPPIGSSRINGADHNDWSSRMFHKKCYKELLKM